MPDRLILSQYTLEELTEALRKIVKEEIAAKEASEDKLLTQAETARLLRINKGTLISWGKQGKVNPHYMGGRVYYKKSEIDQSLDKLKRFQRN